MAAFAAAGLLVGPLALPAAFADNLDDQKHKVDDQIDRANDELDVSSAQLQAATAALLKARSALSSARSYLARTQAELADAKALDREMQARLDAAIERLNKAQLELDRGEEDYLDQEAQLRRLVVSSYEQGDPSLMGLSMVFTTQDPAQLTGNLNANDDVVAAESAILQQLKAARVLLKVKADELADAKAEVAQRRREAAANLERKQTLEQQAKAAKQKVADLVVGRQKATAAAMKAKRADLERIRELQAERDRIQALIERKTRTTKVTGYVDGAGALTRPVDGYVTSPFGWRIHPIYGYRELHDGQDIAAACGTPIRAAADGVVISEYYQTAWGNRIILNNGVIRGVGVTTIYNHMRGFAVSNGERVTRGQVIGYVGNTGWSTGCHVHFTVNQNGVPVDPANWF